MAEKETMQNTIKNLQARTENIEKLLEKGNRCIVIHIGSHSLKVGFANDRVPHRVRTLIAYKTKKPQAKMEVESNYHQQDFVQEFTKMEDQLREKGILSTGHKVTKGKPKAKMELKMKLPDKPFHWTSPLFDEQALWVIDNPQYIVRRPIKHGMLNIQTQTPDVIVQDLVNIVSYSIKEKLKIKTNLHSFSAILILPDVFCRPHIKILVRELFRQLGFKSMYFHMESVMACFSSTVSSACVVDIGYQKINIACVEEGVILPGTLIRKNFGGKHISSLLEKTIKVKNLTWLNKGNVEVDEENEADMFQFENLKEKAAFLQDPEEFGNRLYQLFFLRKGKEEVIIVPHSDLFCIGPNGLFGTIWNQLEKPFSAPHFDYNSKLFQLYSDPQDPFQQFSGGGQTIPSATDHPYYNVDMSEPYIYNPLEQIIAYSIANVKDADMRRRMMSNILLVGGTSHLPRLAQILQPRLIQKLKFYDSSVDKIQFIDLSLRDIPPIFASWTGGAVVPKLDVLKDLWVQRGKFLGTVQEEVEAEDDMLFQKKFFNKKQSSQEWGISYLKEKLPFQW